MRMETVDSGEVPSLTLDQEELMKRGDPVAYLKAFARIARRQDRTRIGFDRQTLEWVSKMWNEASIASMGDDAITHEAERYKSLLKNLEQGMIEYGQEGVVFLTDGRDWPRAQTIHNAIRAFRQAQISVIR